MKIIAGLGNPGSEYAKTKHNVGWMLADAIADRIGASSWKEQEKGMVAQGFIGGEKVLIVKPMTYMNNSGECNGALSLIHILRCRRSYSCIYRWSPYH